MIVDQLTARQRAVVIAIAIDGVSTATLAAELATTPRAIYKTLQDARKALTAQLALCGTIEDVQTHVEMPGRRIDR